jgi:hypothetical protein
LLNLAEKSIVFSSCKAFPIQVNTGKRLFVVDGGDVCVATYISYTSHSYTYMHIKIKQNYFKKYLNFVYVYNFFSYLDIFSLDNDSFDYRNVD